MATPTPDESPDPAEMSYEQAVAALEAIIDRIESGEIGLEQSIAAYERGLKLKARCEQILSQAEQRIEHLSAEQDTLDEGDAGPA